MAVYGPVRHQKNIIWTSEASVYIIFFWWWTGPYTAIASVHIIFFWWRTGPYTAIWPSVPWTICYIIYFTSVNIQNPLSKRRLHFIWSYTTASQWMIHVFLFYSYRNMKTELFYNQMFDDCSSIGAVPIF